jgi:hypothetical protein
VLGATKCPSIAPFRGEEKLESTVNLLRITVGDFGDRAFNCPAPGATSLSYDLRGNLTTSGTSGYSFTSENLLKSGPASAALSYDPAMRLYETVGGGVTTRFLYDGADMIAEYNGANVLQRRYVHGPKTPKVPQDKTRAQCELA